MLETLDLGRKPSLQSAHFRIPPKHRSAESDFIQDEVVRNGRLRALRDQLTENDDALLRLRLIFEEDRSFTYAQILAARHRIWRVEEGTLPPVAAAFEAALADEDRALLEKIG